MFKKLIDLSFQRTRLQAVGFYVAHVVLIALIGSLMAGIFGKFSSASNFQEGFQLGVKVGSIVAFILSITFSFSVVRAKNIFSYGTILLIVLSGILSLFLGAVGGLLPTAYLTTRESKK